MALMKIHWANRLKRNFKKKTHFAILAEKWYLNSLEYHLTLLTLDNSFMTCPYLFHK